MPTTFAKSSRTSMKSQKIGKENNFQALTWTGIMSPSTMNAHAAYKPTDKLKFFFYNFAQSPSQTSALAPQTSLDSLWRQSRIDPRRGSQPKS